MTKTILFLTKPEIPQARRNDITYGRIVCVNPRFGTNSFLERGLSDLEFFLAPTHNWMGTPRFRMGTILLSVLWLTHNQKPEVRHDPHFRTGLPVLPVLKRGSPFQNGDITINNPCSKTGIPISEWGVRASTFQNGDGPVTNCSRIVSVPNRGFGERIPGLKSFQK